MIHVASHPHQLSVSANCCDMLHRSPSLTGDSTHPKLKLFLHHSCPGVKALVIGSPDAKLGCYQTVSAWTWSKPPALGKPFAMQEQVDMPHTLSFSTINSAPLASALRRLLAEETLRRALDKRSRIYARHGFRSANAFRSLHLPVFCSGSQSLNSFQESTPQQQQQQQPQSQQRPALGGTS